MSAASRRGFLSILAGAGTATMVTTPGHAARRAGPARVRLLETYVAAMGNHASPAAVENLRAGDPVVLRREPDNSFDRRAVSVWTADGERLGYVPRIENKALANMMDGGLRVEAHVATTARSASGWSVGLTIDLALSPPAA